MATPSISSRARPRRERRDSFSCGRCSFFFRALLQEFHVFLGHPLGLSDREGLHLSDMLFSRPTYPPIVSHSLGLLLPPFHRLLPGTVPSGRICAPPGPLSPYPPHIPRPSMALGRWSVQHPAFLNFQFPSLPIAQTVAQHRHFGDGHRERGGRWGGRRDGGRG